MADEHLAYAAAFVAARLDEDKATAKALMGAARMLDAEPDFYGVGGPAAMAHWQRFDPARMLRDVAAGLAIVSACTRAAEADPYSPAGVLALAVLEAMSAGWEHPGRPFVPDWTVSPGLLLRKELEARGIDPGDVLGAQRIIDGTLKVDAVCASVLAGRLGTSAESWLNAQRLHDAAILRGATDDSKEGKR